MYIYTHTHTHTRTCIYVFSTMVRLIKSYLITTSWTETMTGTEEEDWGWRLRREGKI